MGIIPRSSPGYDANGLCTTPACISIANNILSSMDLDHAKIDPCTDFDKLVCGNWADTNPLPAGQMYMGVLESVNNHVYDLARRVLEGPYPSGPDAGWITVNLTKDEIPTDKENFAKLQEAYQVCMNSTAQEEQGISQLRELAKTVVEKFPAHIGSKKLRHFDHSSSMGEIYTLFESFGIETTQRFLQHVESKNPDKTMLMIYPPSDSWLPPTPEAVAEFLKLSSELFASVHPANLTKAQAYTLMESVVEFQLAITPPKQSESAPGTNSTGKPSQNQDAEEDPNPDAFLSITEIQKLAPQLNFKYVVGQLAPKEFDDSKISFPEGEFYKNVSQKVSETPPDVIQSYFLWRAIAALSTYIESPEIGPYKVWQMKSQGKDSGSPIPRWRRCTSIMDEGAVWISNDKIAKSAVGPTGLTWILTRFFADKHFTPDAKKLTSEIIDNLENAFIKRIETRPWATSEVKKRAIEKVRAMASKIGLPTSPNVVDPKALKELYADIKITPSLVLNVLSGAKSRVAQNWATLGKPYDRNKIESSTLTTNAFHQGSANSMIILAGIQQSPIYDVGYPAYINYGGMGAIVGHEITHGFDNNGHKYDKTGKKSTWFDTKSTEGFEKASQCFVKQYSKYTVTGPDGEKKPVDGKLTLGENVADAGGVLSGFAAWKQWEKDNGKAQDLPGLGNFTHDQLFFVKWGQNWCGNIKPDIQVALLADEHSPNNARILLPLKNSADFQRAFKCPQKKPVCELW
ncbi:hypothetical protein F53441_274 [Fusarium austroafricanum]|uniref:Endothelin-converting enzyme 1 n=1 Tax=Fusarium austroafricanum TaxID=2364996 RepID=A0A8H4P6I6_9HYPO|nr:hypothetical protein F53441_274 [Fusarium austroafricanum]